MPAKPQWFARVSEIIDLLSLLSTPIVDRAIVEKLFRMRRRQAIKLMHSFDGFRSGRILLVARESLIKQLRALQQSDDVIRASMRKARLTDYLNELHRSRSGAAVKLRINADRDNCAFPLPRGMSVRPGELVVKFDDPEGLFRTLYEFGQAAAADYDTVAGLLTKDPA